MTRTRSLRWLLAALLVGTIPVVWIWLDGRSIDPGDLGNILDSPGVWAPLGLVLGIAALGKHLMSDRK